jgi:hypothetical protein
MPNISEHEVDPARELAYRRGYTHGVKEMISAIVHKLSASEKKSIEIWFANELTPWSRAGQGHSINLPPPPPIPS